MRRAASAAGVYMLADALAALPQLLGRARGTRSCSIAAGGLVGRGEHVGLDRAGHDLEHADPELRDLGRERLADRAHRRLARRGTRRGTAPARAVDDDVTLQITPPPASRMQRDRVLRDLDEPEHVGLEDRAPRRRPASPRAGGCRSRRRRCSRARASPSGRSHRRRVGDVEPLDADASAAPASARSAPSAGSRIVATASKPRARELDRDRAPDPPARARHHRDARWLPCGEHTSAALVPSRRLDLRFTPDAGALPRRRARVAHRPARRTVRGRARPRRARRRARAASTSGWAWEQELGRDGWIGLGWPAEYGGRGATLVEQVIFYEEYARAGGPGRVGIVGEGPARPDDRALRLRRRRSARFLPGHPPRHRDLVPGLLRARRRLRPRQRADPRRARRRRVGDHRPEGVDVARALGAVDLRARAAPNPDAPKHKGLSYLLVPMDQPGIEIRPIVQITGHSRVQRDVLRRRAHRRPRTSSARSTTAGASRWARSRSSGARRRSASSSRSSSELRDDHRARAAQRRRAPIRCCASGSPTRGSRCASCASTRCARCPMLEHGTVDAGDVDPQAVLGDVPPRARRARGRRAAARPAMAGGRRRAATACSSTAAPTRSTAARTRSSATSSASGRWGCRRSRR